MHTKRLLKEINQKAPARAQPQSQLSPSQEPRGVAVTLLQLQRSHGNRFVQRLLHPNLVQAKLTVSQPDDSLELEADRLAEAVMTMPALMTEGISSGDQAQAQEQLAQAAPTDEKEQLLQRQLEEEPESTASVQSQEKEKKSTPTLQSASDNEQLVQREGDEVTDAAAGGNTPYLPPTVETRIEHIEGGGEPLPESEREFFEPRMGVDLSNVRIHTDETAAQTARELSARAYTVGRHIAFNAGEYEPGTLKGRRLLAHELIHVLQQTVTSDLIQRLIRSPYPWRGIITPTIGANIRSSPDLSDPTNILDSIPQGQIVNVISSTGNWLRVQSRYRGPLLEGYVFHTLVDDAASHAMESSVGTTMVWRPSGPGSGTDFESWASAPTEAPFPAVTSTTRMNCWEAVLLSAYRAGAINWKWIHDLYVSVPVADWVATMSRGTRHVYSVPGPNPRMPQRGDIVFFDGLAHVALATGTGSNVYTFWPPPNTPFSPGGTTDKVKVFTIEDLVSWWAANMPPQPVVEFAAPAW